MIEIERDVEMEVLHRDGIYTFEKVDIIHIFGGDYTMEMDSDTITITVDGMTDCFSTNDFPKRTYIETHIVNE